MNNERNLFNAPDGVKIIPGVLIQVNHYWGRGATIGEAWLKVKEQCGSTVARLKKDRYIVYAIFNYKTDDDETTVFTYINEMGNICYHRDYPPHLIDTKK